ncbi:cytochrome P450 [Panus rudis PR-1116 ss-1]|nr:cytochrome P450 [Panus rudis PR-1116 ss-1]
MTTALVRDLLLSRIGSHGLVLPYLLAFSETYGPVFRVLTAGKEATYVTSPSLIAAVYRDAKTFEFSTIRLDFSLNVFHVPRVLVESSYMTNEYFALHHRALAPTNVPSLLSRYSHFAHTQLLDALSRFQNQSLGLQEFIIIPAYVAAAYTIFGPEFPAKETFGKFRTFDVKFPLIAAGTPKFLLREAHNAWDEVIGMVQEFLKTVDPEREDLSELMKITFQAGREAGWDEYGLATMLSSDLWALEANAIWALYWVIALMLDQPHGLTPLISELDSALSTWTSQNPTTPLTSHTFKQYIDSSPLPLLTSAINEALRVSTSTFSIRRVVEPTRLGGYTFEKDDVLICSTRSVHLDEEVHLDAGKFVVDRYVTENGDGDGKNANRRAGSGVKDGKKVPNHSMPFGGGVSMCEGRHFALGELKIYLAMLLTYVDIQPDPKSSARPSFNMGRLGGGIMPPVGDVQVIIRKRERHI